MASRFNNLQSALSKLKSALGRVLHSAQKVCRESALLLWQVSVYEGIEGVLLPLLRLAENLIYSCHQEIALLCSSAASAASALLRGGAVGALLRSGSAVVAGALLRCGREGKHSGVAGLAQVEQALYAGIGSI